MCYFQNISKDFPEPHLIEYIAWVEDRYSVDYDMEVLWLKGTVRPGTEVAKYAYHSTTRFDNHKVLLDTISEHVGYLNNDTEVKFVVNDGPTEESMCATYMISGTVSTKHQAKSDPDEDGKNLSCVKNEEEEPVKRQRMDQRSYFHIK